MFPAQQLIKALRKLQATNANAASDLSKSLRQAAAIAGAQNGSGAGIAPSAVTPLLPGQASTSAAAAVATTTTTTMPTPTTSITAATDVPSKANQSGMPPASDDSPSQSTPASAPTQMSTTKPTTTTTPMATATATTTPLASEGKSSTSLSSQSVESGCSTSEVTQQQETIVSPTSSTAQTQPAYLCSNQKLQNLYQQQLHHFHTQKNQNLNAKQKQTTFSMSSLAAEPLVRKADELVSMLNTNNATTNGTNCHMADVAGNLSSSNSALASSSASGTPCFNTGLAEILQFMELIGNLKHTKRTGWVLRNVADCESISGHMYRMSMMTFLLDGSEGLNQIRCMELALVHDLAESLVGDITPFCGISKTDKRAMEFKAMEDICKLIEPRGKRIMELFEEYENGQSAESRFVKDLDRLDMIMQAFEYEKRDNCLLKHQEFFDSTKGKFNHPFVKKLVDEIYNQREQLAKAQGAIAPPTVQVPNMDEPSTSAGAATTNGHCSDAAADEMAEHEQMQMQKSKSSS